jgi:deoxyribodipyrimidine photo-lyase
MTLPEFPPTRAAALERLAAIDPAAYAATRNHLKGAVTYLSPYLTHGLLDVHEVVAHHQLPLQHSLTSELGWRCFFQHQLQHLGERLLDESQKPAPMPERAYAKLLPLDVREGRTGLAVIDQAVRQLYTCGYLHNHARLWLASYIVHGRRVHWRAGADWLYGHLLDGDAASNHGSWQWVAQRPYLFNADNVARFAPRDWQVPGTVLDASYEVHEDRAQGRKSPLPAGPGTAERVEEPLLLDTPPEGLFALQTPELRSGALQLRHPWHLADLDPGTPGLLLLPSDGWKRLPWSAARWRWVAARAAQLGVPVWWGPAKALAFALQGAEVAGQDHPRLPAPLRALPGLSPAPSLAPQLDLPGQPLQRSFSSYWKRVGARS